MRAGADLAAVAAVVRGYRFTYATERDLQDGIAEALERAGMKAEREAPLDGGRGRVDLLVGSVGVEVKIAGGRSEVAGQVTRYLAALDGLVLVTGRATHAALSHPRLEVVLLGGAF